MYCHIHCTMYIIRNTQGTIHCTPYSILYTVQCTVYTSHRSTMYPTQRRPHQLLTHSLPFHSGVHWQVGLIFVWGIIMEFACIHTTLTSVVFSSSSQVPPFSHSQVQWYTAGWDGRVLRALGGSSSNKGRIIL